MLDSHLVNTRLPHEIIHTVYKSCRHKVDKILPREPRSAFAGEPPDVANDNFVHMIPSKDHRQEMQRKGQDTAHTYTRNTKKSATKKTVRYATITTLKVTRNTS